MAVFDSWTYQQFLAAIPDRTAAWLAANAAFYHGDHWQNGDAWTGPRLAVTHPLYSETWVAIREAFVSSNKIREIVGRETQAAVGDEPVWTLTPRRGLKQDEMPNAAEQALIDEATAIFQGWWDARKAHRFLKEAVTTAAWAKRGMLRLFVPPGRLVDGVLPTAPVDQAAGYLYLHCPEPQQAAVAIDPNTQAETGIYQYQYQETMGSDPVERMELCYQDETGATLLRVMDASGQDVQEPATLDLGGRLLLHQMHRPGLISEQVRSLQRSLNKALTMMDRNGTQGGFLERIVTNAQLPGHMEPDTEHPGLEKFVAEPMHLGPGTTNFLAGVVLTDANGNQSIATPGVHYRDPVSPATFIQTKDALYRAMLEECQQVHVLMASDATASGESRKQARAEFEEAVTLPASLAEDALRWLIESVLALTALFAGQPGRYAGLRASVQAKVDLGPVSAEELKTSIELVSAKLLSATTAMSRNGVQDVPAEQARIAEEQTAQADLAQQMLEMARRGFDQGSGDGGQGSGDGGQESGDGE